MEKNMVIKNFLARYVNIDEINEDTNLYEEGLVNSLFAMQLIMFLEDQFQIRVQNDEIQLKNFATWRSIVQFVQNKLA